VQLLAPTQHITLNLPDLAHLDLLALMARTVTFLVTHCHSDSHPGPGLDPRCSEFQCLFSKRPSQASVGAAAPFRGTAREAMAGPQPMSEGRYPRETAARTGPEPGPPGPEGLGAHASSPCLEGGIDLPRCVDVVSKKRVCPAWRYEKCRQLVPREEEVGIMTPQGVWGGGFSPEDKEVWRLKIGPPHALDLDTVPRDIMEEFEDWPWEDERPVGHLIPGY
jgi:hypothetical protein